MTVHLQRQVQHREMTFDRYAVSRYLKGLGGDDTFIGGLGKDILEAGIGIKLAGGPNKDIYKL